MWLEDAVCKAGKSPRTILGFGGICAGCCWRSLPVLAVIRRHQIPLNPCTGPSMVDLHSFAIGKTPKQILVQRLV